ncbi:MAG TPA: LD-carboxypeptidase [Candidatus Gastranaerophilales bacterium]|nr:LD-carboxypeptidase [Candidatus Gastranaerophilales bacterium]
MKIKPQKLNPGDTIGVISPSGALKEEKLFNNAVKYFETKGFKIKTAPHALDKNAYLAGKDCDRLHDLESFFKDEEIKAILCSRGGYGTHRILNSINYDLVRNNPKIFVGYSDITSLLCNFTQKSGLITFHGPLFASDFGKDKTDEYTEESFRKILTKNIEIPYGFENAADYHCIKAGKAEGELLGGNLAILCGLLGTPYFPDFSGKILLLEDIGEHLYKIDRMLMQLKLAGVFEKISGILFAEFSDITGSDNLETNSLCALNIVSELTCDLNIPVGYGFPAGHGFQKATLPFGVEYFFNSNDFKLQLTEDYLQ